MRETEPTRRSAGGLPRLYQKYIGHDNNRDFYMSTQPESTNMNRVMYLEWFPQIMYNHHQTGPAGTVMFAPPFRDPFNYNFDPLIPAQLDLVAAAMHSRFASEGKPGVTSRRGASYSTWWNGGLRTMAYFHNMVGLLTETIGNPTPMTIPFLPSEAAAGFESAFPDRAAALALPPVVDYSVTANYAVFDIASRNKENFLYNIYQMGKNSIDRGNRDSWTPTPRRVIAATAALGAGRAAGAARTRRAATSLTRQAAGAAGVEAAARRRISRRLLRDPATRDPRGFILPSDQPDFPTATKFVNTLMKTGVAVHRATAAFSAGGKNYPAGSYVVKAAQAFRPHVLDMFEPQDHPDDIPYPGGPPSRPYDNAGWTLAYQMGVKFDRVLDGFDGPFEKLTGLQKPAAGKVTHRDSGWLHLQPCGQRFVHGDQPAAGRPARTSSGSPADRSRARSSCRPNPRRRPRSRKLAATSASPSRASRRSRRAIRSSCERSGSRWPISTAARCRPAGRGSFSSSSSSRSRSCSRRRSTPATSPSRYDVIIFPSGVGPCAGGGRGGRGGGGGGAAGAAAERRDAAVKGDEAAVPTFPPNTRASSASYTAAQTGPQLKKFLEDGGTILGVGRSSASLAELMGLPVENHLVERSPDGRRGRCRRRSTTCPGSILRVAVDTTAPVAHGITNPVDVFFDNSPVFELGPDAR